MSFYRLKFLSLILFLLSFIFLPGRNYYLNLRLLYHAPSVEALASSLPDPALLPVRLADASQPYISAASAIVIDRDSSVILFEKNPRTRLLPASTVKIMTALVALEHYAPDDILTVFGVYDDGQDIGLRPGEKLTAEALLYGLLVASGNDAARAFAQNYPGGESEFVAAMNAKAKALNLADTYFANPTGLDSDEIGPLWADHSYTTTLDLARLSGRVLGNPLFARVVQTPRHLITDVTGQISHPLYNLNQLLGKVEGLKGVKTGWTEEAGECLVSYVERNGRGLVVVVLKSADRFGDSARLIDWAYRAHRWFIPEELQPI